MTALRDVFPGVPLVESPLFHAMVDELGLTAEERRIAFELHERGYTVIEFPDRDLDGRIDRIKAYLTSQFEIDMMDPSSIKGTGHRIQDAWVYNGDIRAIASNPAIVDLLSKVYGRRAFPFQTLNFPVGTAQHLHSDSIHFSSIPERFMCGVWLALEDVHVDAGPVTYVPGSHKWPILSNAMIGRRASEENRENAQIPFEIAWKALVEISNAKQEVFLAKKGQALIWAANLLHGGSPQLNPKLTRWSQVSHYYFENCTYYTPAFSDEAFGLLDLRSVIDAETMTLRPNTYLGETIGDDVAAPTPTLIEKIKRRIIRPAGLPKDFNPETYYLLNPDVTVARLDAIEHYLSHGKKEGRRYRFK